MVNLDMRDETKKNIQECYEHIKPYLDSVDDTENLRTMCKDCECYCGKDHDYNECKDKPCFKFFLAFEYLEWMNSSRWS